MTNKIKQHVPAFVNGFEGRDATFNTTAELLAIPFVKDFETVEGFYRFSLNEYRLMAEYYEGTRFWVVGFLDTSEGIELPKWESPRTKIK